jgi:hypothetical protein
MTRHCWKCGWTWPHSRLPGRSELCPSCQSDLRVCRNCVSYDTQIAYQCRERRADPVTEKHLANYCEYFEFASRAFVAPVEDHRREAAAREALRKLL